MEQNNTKKMSLQERLDQMGAFAMELTPGAGEDFETIFEGVGLLARSNYPVWRVRRILRENMVKKCLPWHVRRYDELVYDAAKLVTTDAPSIPGLSSSQVIDIGYELLYELLIAPFLYLDNVHTQETEGDVFDEDSSEFEIEDAGDNLFAFDDDDDSGDDLPF